MSDTLWVSCRNTLRKFADDTTLHGFKELYHAKSLTWKIIWFVMISVALALTTFQLYQAIQQAADQQTTTVIEPLSSTPKYPPLKICYLHWMYWVNWTTATQLGFDRGQVLFGMSYLTSILSVEQFDVGQTRTIFLQTMKKNNFNKLLDFYRAVSNPMPPGFTLIQLTWNYWTREIDPYAGRLCYVANNELIQSGLAELANKATDFKSSLQLNYEPNYYQIPEYVHLFEYEQYLTAYVVSLLHHPLPEEMPVDLDEFKAAPVLNVDNVRINFIMPSKETFSSQIKITGTLFRWMNNDKRPCKEKVIAEEYDYCDKICYWREVTSMHPGRCLDISGAVLFNTDNPENVCFNNFTFIINNGTMVVAPGNAVELVPLDQLQNSATFKSCLADLCEPPCEEWKFASTVSSLPVPTDFTFLGFPTLLYVEYPAAANILVMTEIAAQTWETVIGNIGGIIGLWLGASVMSVMQLFYLCCFSQCDEKLSQVFMKKRSNVEPRRSIHGIDSKQLSKAQIRAQHFPYNF